MLGLNEELVGGRVLVGGRQSEGELGDNERDKDLDLHHTEVLADTGSGAQTEGDVGLGVLASLGDTLGESLGLEVVGVGAPDFGVPVQSGDEGPDADTLGDNEITESDVLGGLSADNGSGRVESHSLLDDHGDGLEVGDGLSIGDTVLTRRENLVTDLLLPRGVESQQHEAPRDRNGGGVVAGKVDGLAVVNNKSSVGGLVPQVTVTRSHGTLENELEEVLLVGVLALSLSLLDSLPDGGLQLHLESINVNVTVLLGAENHVGETVESEEDGSLGNGGEQISDLGENGLALGEVGAKAGLGNDIGRNVLEVLVDSDVTAHTTLSLDHLLPLVEHGHGGLDHEADHTLDLVVGELVSNDSSLVGPVGAVGGDDTVAENGGESLGDVGDSTEIERVGLGQFLDHLGVVDVEVLSQTGGVGVDSAVLLSPVVKVGEESGGVVVGDDVVTGVVLGLGLDSLHLGNVTVEDGGRRTLDTLELERSSHSPLLDNGSAVDVVADGEDTDNDNAPDGVDGVDNQRLHF